MFPGKFVFAAQQHVNIVMPLHESVTLDGRSQKIQEFSVRGLYGEGDQEGRLGDSKGCQ